jgi:hypothetical protein
MADIHRVDNFFVTDEPFDSLRCIPIPPCEMFICGCSNNVFTIVRPLNVENSILVALEDINVCAVSGGVP